jgi:eukaryotic-like serine/threonine-protein kinase
VVSATPVYILQASPPIIRRMMRPARPLPPARQPTQPRVVGRYLMYEEISCGGMASVHFGRLSSDAGFSRTVAIKYLHPQYARDVQFISMFLDEARLVSRIRHPNVAAPLDVVVVPDSEEVFLVMEYIHGETLGRLIEESHRIRLPLPPNVCANILCGALHGLHAAHEAVDEMGQPLGIVHRDISPQNIMVGSDGVPRVLDFGIAKAVSRSQATEEGQVKGKVAYMAPEQLTNGAVDRRADIFAAGIVLWESLTTRRLFRADHPAAAMANVLHTVVQRPSCINGNVSQAMDRVVLKALQRNPAARFQTARDFAAAIEEEAFVASTRKVSEWVASAASACLADRAEKVARIESESLDPSTLDGAEQSARSMRTISQTVAVLRESDLQDAEQQGMVFTPPPRTAPVGPQGWDAATTVTSTSAGSRSTPAPPAAECGQSTAADSSAYVDGPQTKTETLSSMRRRRRLVVAASTGLIVMLASVAAFVVRQSASVGQYASPQPAAIPSNRQVSAEASAVRPIAAVAQPPAEKVRAAQAPGPVAGPTSMPKKSTKPVRTARSAKDCDPPFYVDRDGIRRVKPQCL